VGVTGVRGCDHENANVLDRNRLSGELQNSVATFGVRDYAIRKSLPEAESGFLDGVFAGPILDGKFCGVRLSPGDTDGGDVVIVGEIENDPLRMERIVFVREGFGKIGI